MAKAKKKGFSKKTKQALLDDGVPENYISVYERMKLQLDEGIHLAKVTYRKARSSASTKKPSGQDDDFKQWLAEEWQSLRPFLRMDFWKEDDLLYYLLGLKKQGAGISFKVIDLRRGEVVSGEPITRVMNEHDTLSKQWQGTDHDILTLDWRFQGRGVPIDYAIEWAWNHRVNVPWLDWARKEKLLSEKLLSLLDEEEQEREPEYKYDYEPLSSDWGYFPYLESILAEHCGEDKACAARPKTADVYDTLMDMETKDVEFDEEPRTLRYRTQDGEWSDWIKGAALSQAIRARLTKRKTTS